MKTTIVSIAMEAGVSTATVDRVLNNRAGVKERTRDRVMNIAERLGYLTEAPSNGAKRGTLAKLDFVLPGGTNTFLNMLAGQIETAVRGAPLRRPHQCAPDRELRSRRAGREAD